MNLLDELTAAYGEKLRGKLTIRTPRILCKLICNSVGDDSIGAFGIVPCEVDGLRYTLVLLGGTEFVANQATGVLEDIATGFEIDTDYTRAVVAAIKEHIAPSERLIITGLSLGGMVAQQVAANKELKAKYDITKVLCFGAPLIKPFKRSNCVRFVDASDIVPRLSVHSILSPLSEILKRKEQRRMRSEYRDAARAHALSYVAAMVWDQYDVMGAHNGACMTVDADAINWYEALRKED